MPGATSSVLAPSSDALCYYVVASRLRYGAAHVELPVCRVATLEAHNPLASDTLTQQPLEQSQNMIEYADN